MTKPANSWKHQRSPILPKPKGREGKRLGIDWDKVEPSFNHQGNSIQYREELMVLRRRLVEAERDGRYSAATRLRREISQLQENELALQVTHCGTCLKVLHLCRCEDRKVSRHVRYRRRKKEERLIALLHRVLGGE